MCFPSLMRQWGKGAVACRPSGRTDWAHTEASSAQQKGRGTPAPFYAPSEVFTFNLLSFPPFAPPWFTERIPYIHPLQWALSPGPQTFRAERQVPQLPVSLVTARPWLVVPAVNSPAERLPCPSSGSLRAMCSGSEGSSQPQSSSRGRLHTASVLTTLQPTFPFRQSCFLSFPPRC